MARDKSRSPSRVSPSDDPTKKNTLIPRVTIRDVDGSESSTPNSVTPKPSRRNTTIDLGHEHPYGDLESAPLLGQNATSYGTNGNPGPSDTGFDLAKPSFSYHSISLKLRSLLSSLETTSKSLTHASTYTDALTEAVLSFPAVILGMLLNILDGVSYGFIMFPAGSMFDGFGGLGVSMFFVTTIIAQLTYSLGGSLFKGGNGSMMIEVVPFFHMIVNGIIAELGEDDPQAVIATTMVAFALSSVLTGEQFEISRLLVLRIIIKVSHF
jgi:sulfate permease, SulP family